MNVKFDPSDFEAKGIGYIRSGNLVRFIVPGRSEVVQAHIDEKNRLDLQPGRSSQHKALAQALGLAV